jgi:hypothetical protein
MTRCKNVGGAPSDGDGSPPHLTEVDRGKHKKVITRKRKRTKEEVAQAVAKVADRAERGGLVSVVSTLRDDSLVQKPPSRQKSSQ